MKRFDLIKTLQLALLVALAGIALYTVLADKTLYAMMGSDPHIQVLGVLLWILLVASFGFLFYDFNSYARLRRENMELDNAIYSDALTGIANRYSVDVYLSQYLNKPLPSDMGCVTIDLCNLSELNQRLGHSGGDTAIQKFSEILQQTARGVCFIGRNGGNKFVAIFRECSEKRLESFLQSMENQVKDHNQAHPEAALTYSTGMAFDEGDEVHTLTELIALSDRRAYMAMQQETKR